MNTTSGRIADTFDRVRAKKGGLVAYVTAGDPDASRSAEILVTLGRAGADVIEVGVPFSDPLADGPVIQRATERALAAGMTLRGALAMIRQIRSSVDAPIVLFTYANPVLRMEPRAFARTAADAGVDGVLILDYPIEEAGPLRQPLVDAGIDPIFLISPTTTDERIRAAAQGEGVLVPDLAAWCDGRTRRPRGRCGAACQARPRRDRYASSPGLWHLASGARSGSVPGGRCGRGRERAGPGHC